MARKKTLSLPYQREQAKIIFTCSLIASFTVISGFAFVNPDSRDLFMILKDPFILLIGLALGHFFAQIKLSD